MRSCHVCVISVILAATMVSACDKKMRPTSHPPDGPPAFQSGWQHGCRSGFVDAGKLYFGATRNAAWYAENADYKRGWDGGFDACKGRYKPNPLVPKKHDGDRLLPSRMP